MKFNLNKYCTQITITDLSFLEKLESAGEKNKLKRL